MRLRLSCLMLTGLAVVDLTAPAGAATIEEALAAAYRNNPTLAATRASLRREDERVPQALSNWRPDVSAFGEVGKARRDTEFSSALYLTPREVGVRLSQPLYRGGRTVAATRAAENTVLAQRANLLRTEQEILLQAARSYVDVIAADANVQLTIQNEQRLARFLQATRDRFAVGEVTRTDVSQAEARLARATADRVEAEGPGITGSRIVGLAAARAAYINVIGEAPTDLKIPAPLADLPTSVKEAIDRATAYNPEVIAADYFQRSSIDAVDVEKGSLLPELNLVAEAGFLQEDQFVQGNRSEDLRALLQLNVPFNLDGAAYSRLRAAKQDVTRRTRELDQARRNTAEAATTAWNDLQADRASVIARKAEVEANTIAVDGVIREQAVGTRTVLDVLDTQQDLIQSQVRLVEARRDEIFDSYALKAAVGQLTAENLALAVDLYDPRQHYDQVRNKWFGGSSSGDMNNHPAPPAAR
jgi:outer membrane protein